MEPQSVYSYPRGIAKGKGDAGGMDGHAAELARPLPASRLRVVCLQVYIQFGGGTCAVLTGDEDLDTERSTDVVAVSTR